MVDGVVDGDNYFSLTFGTVGISCNCMIGNVTISGSLQTIVGQHRSLFCDGFHDEVHYNTFQLSRREFLPSAFSQKNERPTLPGP